MLGPIELGQHVLLLRGPDLDLEPELAQTLVGTTGSADLDRRDRPGVGAGRVGQRTAQTLDLPARARGPAPQLLSTRPLTTVPGLELRGHFGGQLEVPPELDQGARTRLGLVAQAIELVFTVEELPAQAVPHRRRLLELLLDRRLLERALPAALAGVLELGLKILDGRRELANLELADLEFTLGPSLARAVPLDFDLEAEDLLLAGLELALPGVEGRPTALLSSLDPGELLGQTRDLSVALAELVAQLLDIHRLTHEGLGLALEPGDLLLAHTQEGAALGLGDLDPAQLPAQGLDLPDPLLLFGPRALDLLAQALDLAGHAHPLEALFLERLSGLPHAALERFELAPALGQLLAQPVTVDRHVGQDPTLLRALSRARGQLFRLAAGLSEGGLGLVDAPTLGFELAREARGLSRARGQGLVLLIRPPPRDLELGLHALGELARALSLGHRDLVLTTQLLPLRVQRLEALAQPSDLPALIFEAAPLTFELRREPGDGLVLLGGGPGQDLQIRALASQRLLGGPSPVLGRAGLGLGDLGLVPKLIPKLVQARPLLGLGRGHVGAQRAVLAARGLDLRKQDDTLVFEPRPLRRLLFAARAEDTQLGLGLRQAIAQTLELTRLDLAGPGPKAVELGLELPHPAVGRRDLGRAQAQLLPKSVELIAELLELGPVALGPRIEAEDLAAGQRDQQALAHQTRRHAGLAGDGQVVRGLGGLLQQLFPQGQDRVLARLYGLVVENRRHREALPRHLGEHVDPRKDRPDLIFEAPKIQLRRAHQGATEGLRFALLDPGTKYSVAAQRSVALPKQLTAVGGPERAEGLDADHQVDAVLAQGQARTRARSDLHSRLGGEVGADHQDLARPGRQQPARALRAGRLDDHHPPGEYPALEREVCGQVVHADRDDTDFGAPMLDPAVTFAPTGVYSRLP